MENIKNIIKNLTADRDIYGNRLTIGTIVRSFDYSMLIDDDKIFGLDTQGKTVAYAQGNIEAIGQDRIEGCLRYRIKVDLWVRSGSNGMIATFKPKHDEVPDLIYPRANGTPMPGLAPATFGVIAVQTIH